MKTLKNVGNTKRVATKHDDVFKVMRRARPLFSRQLSTSQNLGTKIGCIQQIANETYNDPKRVWYDILSETKRLTNLVDFNAYCKELKVNPENVAQHIVFEGKGVINDVMRYGLKEVVGERIRMFGEPLYNTVIIKGLLEAPKITSPVTFGMAPEPVKQEAELLTV